jgi:hypothetical protein
LENVDDEEFGEFDEFLRLFAELIEFHAEGQSPCRPTEYIAEVKV